MSHVLHLFPISQVTSGGLIYQELKSDFSIGRLSQFYRMVPKGEALDKFGMDETNIKSMIKASWGSIAEVGLFYKTLLVHQSVGPLVC